MKKTNMIQVTRGLLYAVLALFVVGSIINCGGSSDLSPAQVQAPKAMIQDYLAKHQTMVDSSLVNFYVADEQPIVAAAIQKSIDEKTASGDLEKLQQASFDFSNLQISVVDAKEVYVHDEPTKVIKVAVSGSYSMKHADGSETIPADNTIILERVNDQWKVTEKVNPWKEYKYNNRG